jgi:hypothetical protein
MKASDTRPHEAVYTSGDLLQAPGGSVPRANECHAVSLGQFRNISYRCRLCRRTSNECFRLPSWQEFLLRRLILVLG